jgi:hypothetical protein
MGGSFSSLFFCRFLRSSARGGPVTVIDPVLMEKYMLLSAADYDRMVEFLVDGGVDLRDVFASGWRQGCWTARTHATAASPTSLRSAVWSNGQARE